MIKILKEDFLKRTWVDSGDSAMSNSIQAALQHNPTYLPNVSAESRRYFRDAFATSIYMTLLIKPLENKLAYNIQPIETQAILYMV